MAMSIAEIIEDSPIHAHIGIISDKLKEYEIKFEIGKIVELYMDSFLITFDNIAGNNISNKIFILKEEFAFLNKNTCYYNPYKSTINLFFHLNQNINLITDKPCPCGSTYFIKDNDPEKSYIRTCKECSRPRFGKIQR